jgi:hypothetical protein
LFADPQVVTVDTIPLSLPRTGADLDSGSFRSQDSAWELLVSHAYGKRVRRTARFNHKFLAADVMDSSLNVPYAFSTYVVTDAPTVGVTFNQQKVDVAGLLTWLTASSNANLIKFLGGES